MAKKSDIEWTDWSWNPVTGCTKVSQGCKNCYAERMAKRLQAMGNSRYENGFQLTLHEDLINLPSTWKSPRRIFVNSMSDLFHPDVPDDFIKRVFKSMADCPQHTFQVLTKRSERLAMLSENLTWLPNIWMGVSVEDQRVVGRVHDLAMTDAFVKFLSCEPLIGPLPDLPLAKIDWVIVGGESGPKSRPMAAEWVEQIRDQCVEQQVPFFFKQWGGVQKKRFGRTLDGRTWDEMPDVEAMPCVTVRQMA